MRERIKFLLSVAAPSERMVVVDVGANPVHPPPYAGLMKALGCTVVGFEPQEEAYAALVEAAAENEVYVQAALGKPGKGTLHLYPTDGFTSLYRLHLPCLNFLGRFHRQLRDERTIEVELKGMDKIKEVPMVDLLKIDVQGAELDIIQSGKKKLSEAVVIIPEMRFYQLYENEPTLGDLDNELRKMGFVLHKFLPAKEAPLPSSQAARLSKKVVRSQWIDGDAVYIRNMENIDDWSADQLKHLALSAGTVFDSQDLCVRCLDHLVNRKEIDASVPAAYVDLLPPYYLAEAE